MKLDWVMNQDTYGVDSNNSVNLNGIVAVPLTYPRMMFQDDFAGFANARGQWAFPDGEKQFVKAVRGTIYMSTPTWAIGSTLNWLFRITKKPMDFATAGAIVDNNYSLGLDMYANERYVWQECIFDSFTFGNPIRTTLRVNATVNQWLEPDEALFLFIELPPANAPFVNGARLDYMCYLRTLMKAES